MEVRLNSSENIELNVHIPKKIIENKTSVRFGLNLTKRKINKKGERRVSKFT